MKKPYFQLTEIQTAKALKGLQKRTDEVAKQYEMVREKRLDAVKKRNRRANIRRMNKTI